MKVNCVIWFKGPNEHMVNDDGIIRSKEGYLKICNEECNNSFCCETRQNIEIHDLCDLCGTKFSRFKAI